REQLVQCTELWLDDRSRSFLDLVSEAARLEPETRRLLEALVGAHLARHHDDPQESLAALNIGDGVQEFLQRMGSPERSTSPARSSNEATAADPYATLESGSSVDAVDAAPAQHNLTGLSQPRKMVGALSSQGYRFRIL